MDPDEMALAYLRKHTSVEQRVIMHLSVGLQMVRGLPPYADRDSDLPDIVWAACLEDFYVNVRLVAEFFVKMPQRDFTARTFLPSWKPPAEAAKRLEAHWDKASKHVLHLSRDRVPDDMADIEPDENSEEALRLVADDCESVAQNFASEYEVTGAADAEYVRLLLTAP